jgi:hypothetical protein
MFGRRKKEQKKPLVLTGYIEKEPEVTVAPVKRKPGEKVYIPEVQVIHDEFNSEVDRLLAKAKIDREGSDDLDQRVSKLSELSSLGFTNTKGKEETERDVENVIEAKMLTKAIEYFSFTYPQYKFITEDSVKKICKKYSLIYASVGRYIGEVPDYNIKQMQEFKVKDEDKVYVLRQWIRQMGQAETFMSHDGYLNFNKTPDSNRIGDAVSAAKFQIAAPISDFNTVGMRVSDFKLEADAPLDPIVLQPVMYKMQQYYLIVTAWGPEASDPLVVNQKMN